MFEKITVVGAGSWGTALAFLLGSKGFIVSLWTRKSDFANKINDTHENSTYLPGVTLPKSIVATSSIDTAIDGSGLILFVVPSKYISGLIADFKNKVNSDTIITCAIKGFEDKSNLLMSDLFAKNFKNPFVFLGGPSFAAEVGRKKPTAVTVASTDKNASSLVQKAFSTKYFRVYRSNDVTGLQLGGTLKNVIALAAGIADGLGYGYNTRAALITRGLAEIVRLGLAMGAQKETFYGLSGIGDLILTSTGDLSRNRTVGFKIGRGMTLADILASMNMVAEGVSTSTAAYMLSRKFNIYMPIVRETYLILHEGKPPDKAVHDLLDSRPGNENGVDFCLTK